MNYAAMHNWFGIVFVLAIFPAAGMATRALRRWSERHDGGDRRGKIAGGVRVHMRRSTDLEPGYVGSAVRPGLAEWRPANALDSSDYVAPAHWHCFDLARSVVTLCEDGSLVVGCAMRGCGETKTYPANVTAPVRSCE